MPKGAKHMTNNPVDHNSNSIIDPVHEEFGFFHGQMTFDVWKDKYRYEEEKDFFASIPRIVSGVYATDCETEMGRAAAAEAELLMRLGLWMPAGRIMAGAGTAKVVTLLNCYVNAQIEDSMHSIVRAQEYAVLTMQQGGGVGTDFSPIRPSGAILKRTGAGSRASGPLPFIDGFDQWGRTVESAGARRGAQMGTISDTHPDMPAFVTAKQTKGRMTQFNISVLVSDAFMEAKDEDAEWPLFFHVPPVTRDAALEEYDFIDDNGVQQYVYSVWKAKDLWRMITENTYEYSEPGVIFIDRVNELNNLWYCEDIRCTNPCGEQPLPPHNACDLGHVNLARMVRNPFTEDAYFDYDLLDRVVTAGVRFLDNVWDVTNFPLKEQEEEGRAKRRIGLGYTGLADALAQLQLRYGGARSAEYTDRIGQRIAIAAYRASIDLAREKGSFPKFDAEKFLSGDSFVNLRMPSEIRKAIAEHGIRNGVLLTIAPTGTSSIVYGNPSGGLEPFFSLLTKRKVLQPDGTHREYVEGPYAAKLYKWLADQQQGVGLTELPAYFTTMAQLSVHEHIEIQSRAQRWVDASISKTINMPKEISYDEFVKVYDMAYNAGCKGCTTYRPSEVRGSVLEDATAKTETAAPPIVIDHTPAIRNRPQVLGGYTYQIKWPRRNSSLYLTINADADGVPFEVLFASKDGSSTEWTTALSLMITGLFRTVKDPSFIAEELQQIQSVNDGAFMSTPNEEKQSRYFNSLPAYIGYLLGQHTSMLKNRKANADTDAPKIAPVVVNAPEKSTEVTTNVLPVMQGENCPSCMAPTLFRSQGCYTCENCGYSKC